MFILYLLADGLYDTPIVFHLLDWMWRDQQVPSSSSMSAPSSNSNAQYPLHRAVTSYQSDTSGGGASASSNLRVQPSSAPISSASSSSSASPYYSLAQDASLQTLKQNALEHEVNTLRAELAFAQQASAAKDAKVCLGRSTSSTCSERFSPCSLSSCVLYAHVLPVRFSLLFFHPFPADRAAGAAERRACKEYLGAVPHGHGGVGQEGARDH